MTSDMDRFLTLSSDLIGKTEAEARKMVAAVAGCTFAVSRREDNLKSLSANYNIYRFAVEIQDGKVVSVARG